MPKLLLKPVDLLFRANCLKITLHFLILLVIFIAPLPDAFGLNEDFPLPTISAALTTPACQGQSYNSNLGKPPAITHDFRIPDRFIVTRIAYKPAEVHPKIPPHADDNSDHISIAVI